MSTITFPALSARFAGCSDFECRRINVGLENNVSVVVCWIDGLVSGTGVAEEILRPLTQANRNGSLSTDLATMEQILRGSVYRYSVKARTQLQDAVNDLTHGCCLLFFDNAEALSFEVRSEQSRSISQPTLEKSLKGAKDSFVETLRVNTALVRQRVCTPQLKLAECSVGRRSNTRLALFYIEGIANPELVRALARRIKALDVDALLATGTLEEGLVDAPLSPFPQILHTERPDRFAMHLLDGRIGLLVDGLPIGLVLPVSFSEFMKVTGDASVHFAVATALTLLRPYHDYNTAVAYCALDYNASALEVLEGLDRTDKVNYLLALLYSRCGEDGKAAECYLKACRQNPTLVHRGNLDPEISALVKRYRLDGADQDKKDIER